MPSWLEHAVRRGSTRPWTLGAVLDEYCRSEGLTRDQLASLLHCSHESLGWLSLCRRPAPERFAEDLAKIVERFHIESGKLAQIVRRVDALAVLRRPHEVEAQDAILLAARDHDKDKDR